MKFIADFHIHSKYSRATSKDMDLESLDKWAKIKGIKVLGVGDFTHPEWLKSLKKELEPAEAGLFKLRAGDSPTRFILTSEISCIYSKGGRVRKIHIIVFSPSFEICEKINTHLGWVGNLKADGRPILGLDAKELAKIVLNISQDCLIVPAHCLPPETYIHTVDGIKMIKDIKKGDFVYTHKGRVKKVTKIYRRFYGDVVYTLKPFYFREGLTTTSEHPYLVLKNDRYKGENSYYGEQLKRDYFKGKKPKWIKASKIEIGDLLLFPRFRKVKDRQFFELDKVLNPIFIKYKENFISPIGSRVNWIPNIIRINEEFCRLAGYYIAEGYTNSRDAIGFCFKDKEIDYIDDVKTLMDKIFFLKPVEIKNRKESQSVELIYYSKILANAFGHLFYSDLKIKRANSKSMPNWMLELPGKKQIEIFKGWWRGDNGYTASRVLMNQMKIILLRLGIIPSILKEDANKHNDRGNHFFGKRDIFAKYNIYNISHLSFYEDDFGLLRDAEFKEFRCKTIRRNGWIDKNYVYLPVKDIAKNSYYGEVYNLEVEEDNSYVAEFAAVHNCWTPWFSIFGSKSGFNSIEECFEEYSKYIYALETGLSSSPDMNWRLSALDKITLISNSDAHSCPKLGREANVFDTELSYQAIIEAIKSKNPQKFLYTIEFFPEEGKYHYDGHRLCEIRLSPQESKKYNNICPNCGKPLTIGVLNRVEELADRPEGTEPAGAIPFKSLIPLAEIIAEALSQAPGTKGVMAEYQNLVKKFGNEFEILLNTPYQNLKTSTLPGIAEGIKKVREGKIEIEPGYDGVYGKIRIFSQAEKKVLSKQTTLF